MSTAQLARVRELSPDAARRMPLIAQWPLVAYFALAFVGTWLPILPLALSQGEYGLGLLPFAAPDAVAFLLVQVSAYTGPLLAACLVTAATEGGAGVRQLWRRVGQWRVAPRWYAIALALPFLIWLAAYSLVLGGAPLRAFADQPQLLLSLFLPAVIIGLLLPSLGEEPGWRGFALPRLQARYGPLGATLILGTLHSLWHLPAFFTAGLGPFALDRFAAFLLTGLLATFLYTWLSNGAKGSILLAMLFHASFNAAASLLTKLIPADLVLDGWRQMIVERGWLNAITFGLAALAAVALTRGRLAYDARRAQPPGGTPGR